MGCSQSKAAVVEDVNKDKPSIGDGRKIDTVKRSAVGQLQGGGSEADPVGSSSTGCDKEDNMPADSANDQCSPVGKSKNPKILRHSASSVLGLEEMKNGTDELQVSVVHIEVPFGKPIEEVYEGVHDGPVLGSGILGVVRLVSHRSTGIKYAVKCLEFKNVETLEGLQQLREEIYIMCQLDHPNIVRLEEVYESESEIYLVQELCLGGELYDRLEEQSDLCYSEAQCARLVKQMLSSVRYIHEKGIVHRDLKLENFLFSSADPDSELKMIDFGLSKHFNPKDIHHEAVGTPYTVAPEVIRGSYDERCDVWAIGVISYLLLSGEAPFGGCYGEDLMEVRANILRGTVEFEPADIWNNVSQQARDFISSLLVVDPNQRPTASQAQESSWLQGMANRDRMNSDSALNPNVAKALVSFKEYSDLQRLLSEVLSFTLLPDQISDLRREFEHYDPHGTGEISLAGLKNVLLHNRDSISYGTLTEKEVEDVFDAMRVNKTETHIHWHEFIAAGLSQCQVDERNIKLAFDRLDFDHKGYITFENVMDLCTKADTNKDEMRRMWLDTMKLCGCNHARITYDDFSLLMNGQTLKRPSSRRVFPLPELEEISEIPLSESDENSLVEEKCRDAGEPLSTEVGIGLAISQESGNDTTLTPPQSPIRGPSDFVVPQHVESPQRSSIRHMRRRSRSMNHLLKAMESDESLEDSPINEGALNEIKLFNSRRMLRVAVLEASNRFEDEQVRRASMKQHAAGLTMRHGIAKGLSTEAIREMVRKTQREQQKLVQRANKRVGRGKRKKIRSDITGMLGNPPAEPASSIGDEPAAVATRTLHHSPSSLGMFRPTVDPFASLGSVGGGRHVLAQKGRSPHLGGIKNCPSLPPPLPL